MMQKHQHHQKKELFLFLFLLFGSLLLSVYAYFALPDIVPTHWGPAGVADDYSSKWMPILLFPGLMLFMILLFYAISYIAVHKKNIELSIGYGQIKVTVLVFVLLLQFATIWQSMRPFNMNYAMIVLLAFLFIQMGRAMKGLKRNYFVGIKTPWTLASDTIWMKTHELGGKLFIAFGLSFIFAFFYPNQFFIHLIAGVLLVVLVPFFYSLYLFKKKA